MELHRKKNRKKKSLDPEYIAPQFYKTHASLESGESMWRNSFWFGFLFIKFNVLCWAVEWMIAPFFKNLLIELLIKYIWIWIISQFRY